MTRPTSFLLAAALVGAGGSLAYADDPAPATTEAAPDAPAGTVSSELTLPKGSFDINVDIGADLSSGAVFKPFSISPDIWYGATDDVTIGLVHSGLGATGFLGDVGSSLCLAGSSDGCAHVYNNVGLDGRIRLSRPFAVDVGVYIDSIASPFELAAKLGISGRWQWGNLSLEAQPSIFIGLTNRGDGNTETLFVPVTLAYMVVPKLDIAFQPGLTLPFTDPGSTWTVPLSLGVRYAATPQLGIGLAFTFLDLVGGGTTSADFRSLTLGGNYAF